MFHVLLLIYKLPMCMADFLVFDFVVVGIRCERIHVTIKIDSYTCCIIIVFSK